MQMLDGRFTLSTEYQNNTSFVLGLKPKDNSVNMGFRVFANENGNIDFENFNGYTGDASWVKGYGILDTVLNEIF